MYKFTPVLSQISYKPQTMAESSNRFIALDKPVKQYIQEQQNKKTREKPDETLSLLAQRIPQTEGRGKKNFEESKYAESIIDDKEFQQAKKCLEARSKRLKKERQGKQIKRSPCVD